MNLHEIIKGLTEFVEKDVKIRIIRRNVHGVMTHTKLVNISHVTPDYKDTNEVLINLDQDEIDRVPWEEAK